MTASTRVDAGEYPTLAISPDIPFGDLARRLSGNGWSLESRNETPILAAEPEHAVFRMPDGTAAYYTFNPALKLRVMEFRGPAARVQSLLFAGAVPVLRSADIRRLLATKDPRQVLLALLAARAIRDISSLTLIAPLAAHADARIAAAAKQSREALLHAASERIEHAGPFAPEKQLLREVLQNAPESNADIDEFLQAALLDGDPEVRVTAMVTAAKLRAKHLAEAIRNTEVPTSTRYGAWPKDRFFFRRLQQTVIRYLGSPESVPPDFARAVSGLLPVHDDLTLLLYSLTTPLRAAGEPARLPAGIVQRDGRYFLCRTDIELCHVPPEPHWLGEDGHTNPIHRFTPEGGLFIGRTAVDARIPRPLLDAVGREHPEGGETLLFSYAQAVRLCELVSRIEELQVRLPTADEWESAARGPDGRLFPWGNCLRNSGPGEPSPCGASKMSGHQREWTSDRMPDGAPVVCGGEKLLCAWREPAAQAECAVRLVIGGNTDKP